MRKKPIVIAHRGASGYRPEHTLAAYELAIRMGADYIEPDLVATRDGVLVARHENAIAIVNPASGALIEATTDVMSRPEFAARKTTKTIDGVSVTGWFTEDFTLAELKTLRVMERMPLRRNNTLYNGQFQIPTFQEVIDLARDWSGKTGRTIGIYPETKHPSYFDSIRLSLEERLITALHDNGYRDSDSPVFIQSFEVSNLKKLREMTKLPLIQLLNADDGPFDRPNVSYADMTTPAGLGDIAKYADGIGANKNLIIPATSLSTPTTLVRDAHAADLIVHAWAFRNENHFLPAALRTGADPWQYGRALEEYALYFNQGIDGLFSDHPDTAVLKRNDLFFDSVKG